MKIIPPGGSILGGRQHLFVALSPNSLPRRCGSACPASGVDGPCDPPPHRLLRFGAEYANPGQFRALIEPVSYYVLKVVISALLIVAISEIAKRSTGFAALVAALPLTSLLAFVWLHMEAAPSERIAELSGQIFWFVLPSLVLFLLLPFLLRHGLNFWMSLGLSVAATAGCYLALLPLLRRMGIG